ncbi:MAG: N-formylglutamate amidohydrolase, partial [Clostridia bacterium]|nr:N-formylglutamate amidohydrolase [Clostridia bacterium]
MKSNILLHIPHSSFFIPKEYGNLFLLSEKELKEELLKMTDSYTDILFNIKGVSKLVFPVSRLICDVERFRDEKSEEMTKSGMWVCYTKTSDMRQLKKVDNKHKKEILKKYYDVHH